MSESGDTSTLPKDIDPSKLSDKEARFFIFAIQSMRGGEQRLDYPRIAAAAGMSTPKSAMNFWCGVKKKFELSFGNASAASAANGAPAKAPAKHKKRKAATQLVKGENGENDEGAEDKVDGKDPVKDEGTSHEVKECIAVSPKANKKAKTAKTAKTTKTTKTTKTVKSAKVAKDEIASDDDRKNDVHSEAQSDCGSA